MVSVWCMRRNEIAPHALNRIRANPSLAKKLDDYGSTLLIELLPYINKGIIQELINLGTDLLVANLEGFSCLHAIIDANGEDYGELIKMLIDKGADPNLRGRNGWTPLHQAVTYGNHEYVKILLDNGADIELVTEDFDQETPIMIAKRLHNKKMQMLLNEYLVKQNSERSQPD